MPSGAGRGRGGRSRRARARRNRVRVRAPYRDRVEPPPRVRATPRRPRATLTQTYFPHPKTCSPRKHLLQHNRAEILPEFLSQLLITKPRALFKTFKSLFLSARPAVCACDHSKVMAGRSPQ